MAIFPILLGIRCLDESIYNSVGLNRLQDIASEFWQVLIWSTLPTPSILFYALEYTAEACCIAPVLFCKEGGWQAIASLGPVDKRNNSTLVIFLNVKTFLFHGFWASPVFDESQILLPKSLTLSKRMGLAYQDNLNDTQPHALYVIVKLTSLNCGLGLPGSS